ncbi:hypothetical protein VNO77_23144 [Canavalia gladiata]|uniref:Uncharacterized protein n=1 Tax=Canavalia gladiata TaxID=3824 RepID=A0AAN9Q8N1_CANGL
MALTTALEPAAYLPVRGTECTHVLAIVAMMTILLIGVHEQLFCPLVGGNHDEIWLHNIFKVLGQDMGHFELKSRGITTTARTCAYMQKRGLQHINFKEQQE